MTFPLVFISSTLEIVSGEKKTFTSNFAQSAENNADPFFIKSDIYIPYIKGTSETITRILQPYNIRVAHKLTTFIDQR